MRDLSSYLARYHTHIYSPAQPHGAEKHDATFNGNQRKVDDRCKWPKLVACPNNRESFLLESLASFPTLKLSTDRADRQSDLVQRLPLHESHQRKERNRVKQRAHCDAVREPLQESVLPRQRRLPPRPAPFRTGLFAILFVVLLVHRTTLGSLEAGVVLRMGVLAAREGALEKVLPVKIERCGENGEDEKPSELREGEGEWHLTRC